MGVNTDRWTPEEDATLRAMRKKGDSFQAIARKLKRTRHACIGRWDRITLGPKRRQAPGGIKGAIEGQNLSDPYRADRLLRGSAERPWSWERQAT